MHRARSPVCSSFEEQLIGNEIQNRLYGHLENKTLIREGRRTCFRRIEIQIAAEEECGEH